MVAMKTLSYVSLIPSNVDWASLIATQYPPILTQRDDAIIYRVVGQIMCNPN